MRPDISFLTEIFQSLYNVFFKAQDWVLFYLFFCQQQCYFHVKNKELKLQKGLQNSSHKIIKKMTDI